MNAGAQWVSLDRANERSNGKLSTLTLFESAHNSVAIIFSDAVLMRIEKYSSPYNGF